ncbi:MAG: MFS transporter [Tyzzerella sp.]|nr:MFS transporter [Tyzzerella sp.]
MSQKTNSTYVRPFGLRDKLGYLFGDFANDFTFLLSSSWLLKFYTDVMGLDAYVVGIVMAVARIIDAFTDVTMGRICDKSKTTPAGKFKPWLRRMCGPVAISSFLIYQSAFADWSEPAKIAWLTVTYILWGSIFYTSVNIPYGSMASAISPEAGDRQSLSTFRSIGGVLAGVIVGAGIPLFAFTNDAAGNPILDGGKFTIVAGIFSIGAVICYLLCYYLTTERVKTDPVVREDGKKDTFIDLFKRAFKNRSLISIIAASIVMLLAQLTMQQMANYVYPNFYRNTTAQSASTIFMMGGMFIAGAFAKPLAAKFGKAEVAVFSNILAVVVNIILFIIRPANAWVYAGFQFISWLGLGMFTMVSWALITDVIDDMEVKNGIREDGSVYALYSWARKLGQAASSSLTGVLLSIIGYTEATAFEPVVTEGIFNISVIVPAIGFALLALILWFWYPLHKKTVDANIAFLKEKHSE